MTWSVTFCPHDWPRFEMDNGMDLPGRSRTYWTDSRTRAETLAARRLDGDGVYWVAPVIPPELATKPYKV